MNVKQISVFLDDVPGSLAGLADILQQNAINMRALAVADAKDFGIIRMIVDDPAAAVSVMEDAGYVCTMNDVLVVEVEDTPGGLFKILRALGDVDVNIDYSYMLTTNKTDKAYMVARVGDIGRGTSELAGQGWLCLKSEDIAKI